MVVRFIDLNKQEGVQMQNNNTYPPYQLLNDHHNGFPASVIASGEERADG